MVRFRNCRVLCNNAPVDRIDGPYVNGDEVGLRLVRRGMRVSAQLLHPLDGWRELWAADASELAGPLLAGAAVSGSEDSRLRLWAAA